MERETAVEFNDDHTYSTESWSRIIQCTAPNWKQCSPDKITLARLVKILPAFHAIAELTTATHRSLFWNKWIQSPTSIVLWDIFLGGLAKRILTTSFAVRVCVCACVCMYYVCVYVCVYVRMSVVILICIQYYSVTLHLCFYHCVFYFSLSLSDIRIL